MQVLCILLVLLHQHILQETTVTIERPGQPIVINLPGVEATSVEISVTVNPESANPETPDELYIIIKGCLEGKTILPSIALNLYN